MKRRLLLLTLGFGLWTLDGYSQVWKPQNVASTVEIFLRDTTTGNGKTGVAVTGITCDLTKPSDTLSSTKTTFTCAASGSSNDCVEVAHGKYNIELSAANLDTRGSNYLECQCTNAFDAKVVITVISAASYAFMFTGDIADTSSLAAANWDLQRSAHNISGTFGELANTNLDATVSSVNTAVAGVPAATLDLANGVETGYTLRQCLRILLSTQAGKLSGASTNAPVFRDVNDTKNRVTSVTTADGRTSVTLDPN